MKSYNLKTTLVFLLIFLSSCKNAEIQDQNILQLEMSGSIETLDPAKSYDTISAKIIYQGYETLYEYHYLKRPYTIKPLLAEGMPQILNNGKRYIIKIRKNIYYHKDPSIQDQNRTVKAQDFINQFKRLAFKPTKSSGWGLIAGKIKGINKFRNITGSDFNKFKQNSIEGLTALDDYTLVIDLNEPYPQMLYFLTMTFSIPLPIKTIEFYKNDLSNHLVGTGPFKLDHWDSEKKLQLSRFKRYRTEYFPGEGDRFANKWGLLEDAGKKIPFLNKIIFNFQKNSESSWANFINNKIHILPLPRTFYRTAITPLGRLNPKLKKDGIRFLISPTLTYWWLSFNMRDPILGKNRLLRLAIAHAIDIDKFVQLSTLGLGLKANSIYSPGVPGYDPTAELPYKFDVQKAKKLLAQAGFPKGRGLSPITYSLRGKSNNVKKQGEFIKESLKAIGINIIIETNSFTDFLKKSRLGQLQFWYGGWVMDYPDAENSLQLLNKASFPPGPNSAYYTNPKVEILIKQLKTMQDGEEKYALMEKIESLVHHDMPWIMLYYARNYLLYHSELKNFRDSDVIFNYMKYLRLKY